MKQREHTKARLLTMDELHARPCEVDGRPALFLKWTEDDNGHTYALVEYPDGVLDLVEPELIRFEEEGRA